VPAESGKEALGLIASGIEIDVVLADFAMPAMNGVELARAIHPRRPALPLIIMTGHGHLDALKEFDRSRILQEPYAEEDLVEKIAAALA
jgi:DNA-binding NtrC family response regulator